mgnify:CR=1 FL=1
MAMQWQRRKILLAFTCCASVATVPGQMSLAEEAREKRPEISKAELKQKLQALSSEFSKLSESISAYPKEIEYKATVIMEDGQAQQLVNQLEQELKEGFRFVD